MKSNVLEFEHFEVLPKWPSLKIESVETPFRERKHIKTTFSASSFMTIHDSYLQRSCGRQSGSSSHTIPATNRFFLAKVQQQSPVMWRRSVSVLSSNIVNVHSHFIRHRKAILHSSSQHLHFPHPGVSFTILRVSDPGDLFKFFARTRSAGLVCS
jgi:hypothetical protein